MIDIGATVKRVADMLIPGWVVTWELCSSDDIGGALAMVFPTPLREMAHIMIAPHPPGESVEESIAHEMTHAILSPLTALIEYSPAAIMVEERITERLGKVIAKVGSGMARAVSRALQNPRTKSPAVRARISALASGRLGNGRKRMISAEQLTKALEALESGDPEATKAILKELIAAMATGAGEEPPASQNEPHNVGREPEKDGGMGGERDMPPAMREMYRTMRRGAQSALDSTIRLRVHELRTVDKLNITPAVEARLRKAKSVDDFEDRLELVRASLGSAGEQQRARSGAIVEPDKGGEAAAYRLEDLVREGVPERQARDIVELSKKNRVAAEAELSGARIRLRGIAAGGV